MLLESNVAIRALAEFIGEALHQVKLPEEKSGATRLGWVPTSTVPEALLFAVEIRNICNANLTALEKLELLRTLCVMQVLRSLCFQAARFDEIVRETSAFSGNYCWIVGDPNACVGDPLRRIAQSSAASVEALLYRALRSKKLNGEGKLPAYSDLKNGDDNCFRLFRKFAKEIGLVIPRTGSGQRFVLPPHLLRFLVAAVLKPGERIRLTGFYDRVFAHYGIALGERQVAVGMAGEGALTGIRDYAVAADTRWIEETLRQGGLLVELSDAVSIVYNPGKGEAAA